jgi:acyl carrier protein
MATIEERLKKVTLYQFDIEEKQYRMSAQIIEDFDADSVDIVEFMMEIEQEFGLSFGTIGVENVLTIEDALSALKKHVKE